MARLVTGIAEGPLDVPAALRDASSEHSGALAVFVGTVRERSSIDANADRSVSRLVYDAHPTLADERLREICEEAAEKWGLEKVIAMHRTGTCELGEPTVVVACSAAHRAPALEACRYIIDTIKETVPIWKQEVYSDGAKWL